MAYTDRQIQLIRHRLKAYYDVQRAGPRRMTWIDVCGRIVHLVGIEMDQEVLRQFAMEVPRRDRPVKPRIPKPENLEAIVKFLANEDIDMLSVEELKEPEVPYRLALSFGGFLGTDIGGRNLPPPNAINGSYRAEIKDPANLDRKIDLSFVVDAQNSLVRLFERTESYLPVEESGCLLDEPGVFEDALVYLSKEEPRRKQKPLRQEARQRVQSDGWGIFTPEDNLFIFMKGKHYGSNYYYLTLGMDKNLRSDSPICQLLLLRHQYPIQQSDVPQCFDKLQEESDGDTMLLNFGRLEDIEGDIKTA